MVKKAIITGITGQDGAYLASFLLEKGYKVFGAFRRSSSSNFWRLEYLGLRDHPNLFLVEYELTDLSSNIRLIQSVQPDEFYNLAAQSFVHVSFDQPISTAHITGLGTVNILEAIRTVKPDTRFYQASSSEMFGKVIEVPQNESTPFYPRSPYAAAKLYAHWITINYYESYNIFGCSGILFNHESPLRGKEFVTRKVTDLAVKIKLGQPCVIELGNIDSKRDWGYAKEYVEGMWLMLQQEKPETYVLATGRTETVRDFVSMTFQALDLSLKWSGQGENETAYCQELDRLVVKINPKFYRPAEVDLLIGDPSKAERRLGWKATTSLEELAKMMVIADLERVKKGISF
ncbi:MAG: GDP-mannose 4,6-dehydratase [Deltaproteobacteria bacterium]|jgi:GDPmannose 4,6-dehydratase|nr:GDP-mannose 4,6-dehydratase [Deltaproteobacteria bacterium]